MNKGLIIGGIAAIAVIGGAMWYKKAKKEGKLPKWLSADGDFNNATGDCFQTYNYKGKAWGCEDKYGYVRIADSLEEAKRLAKLSVAQRQQGFEAVRADRKAKMASF